MGTSITQIRLLDILDIPNKNYPWIRNDPSVVLSPLITSPAYQQYQPSVNNNKGSTSKEVHHDLMDKERAIRFDNTVDPHSMPIKPTLTVATTANNVKDSNNKKSPMLASAKLGRSKSLGGYRNKSSGSLNNNSTNTNNKFLDAKSTGLLLLATSKEILATIKHVTNNENNLHKHETDIGNRSNNDGNNNSTNSTNAKENSDVQGLAIKNSSSNAPMVISNTKQAISAEERFQEALKQRLRNNWREAGYEFEQASKMGHTKAMYLYGLALKHGTGVRKNTHASLEWLLKAAGIYYEDSDKDYSVDPFDLREEDIPKVAPDPEAKAFYLLGVFYIDANKDENKALQFLEKSASLGQVEAMAQAGMLWQKKGPNRKKDMNRAACWLRHAEKRGLTEAGNSWIYKSKYMAKK